MVSESRKALAVSGKDSADSHRHEPLSKVDTAGTTARFCHQRLNQWPAGLSLDPLSRPHRVDLIHRTDEDFSVAMLAGFCAGLNSGDG